MSAKESTILNVLEQQFTELEKQMNGATNSEAHKIRKSAFNLFKEDGLPDKRDEEYRYTPISKQLDKHFENFVGNPDLNQITVNNKSLPDLDGNVIVFLNGTYSESLSKLTRESGVEIEVATKQKQLMESDLSINATKNAFSGLNLALASSGVKINIAKGTIVEQHINIVHLSNSENGRVMSTPRHEISVGENAQVTISEIFIGSGNHSSFTNSVFQGTLGKSSITNHYKIGLDGDNDLRIDNTSYQQAGNSVFNTVNINYGGKVIRNNLNLLVEGEHCETNLDGLYIPIEGGNVDNHTVVDHKVPNCNSNELYKGIMGDNATGVFNGKVFVRQDAQKTNAFQSNKNLLLSDTATINTKPQLEIWADDVKCSHGCTTGQLDKEMLFYLRARGIDVKSAQKLLLKAFSEEVIEKIKDDKLRARVSALLEEKLAV
jgi:Fe-S cluster assembly protein SufD